MKSQLKRRQRLIILYITRIGPKTNHYNDLGKSVLGIKRSITCTIFCKKKKKNERKNEKVTAAAGPRRRQKKNQQQQQQQSTIINDDNMHEAINEKEKWPANYYTIERQKRYRWNQPRTDITAVRI